MGVMDDYVEEAYDDEAGAGDGGSDDDDDGRLGGGGLLGRKGAAGVGALFRKEKCGARGAMKALPLTGASGRRATALAKQGFNYALPGDSDEEEEDVVGQR